jgi:hypothetical protein
MKEYSMLCNALWEISSVYDDDKLGRSPPHLFMYLVLSSNKMGKTKEGLYWFKNQGAFIQNKI